MINMDTGECLAVFTITASFGLSLVVFTMLIFNKATLPNIL